MNRLLYPLFWAAMLMGVGSASVLATTEIAEFGSNPGNLRMFQYLPATRQPYAPLVVVLHGCQQSALNYDDETGWTQWADRWGFALLLPEQKKENNWQACFNWFRARDTQRDSGEALSIKQMIDKMVTDYSLDPERIYITGLSAGGAMSVVMLAAYPDVFAGGAIVAGIPYHCASGFFSALWCMYWGRDLEPAEWGNRVRQATENAKLDRTGWPIVSIWQGANDSTVQPMNATELMQQWTNVHGISQVPSVEDTVKGYAHQVYIDSGGNPVVETYTLTRMKHGVPIDPGLAEDQCGVADDYILPVGICSSYYIAKFWGLDNPH